MNWSEQDLLDIERRRGLTASPPTVESKQQPFVSTVDRPFGAPLTRHCVIELAGSPKGKGRPRFSLENGHAYTPQPTRNYEAALRYAAQLAMKGAAPITGALRVEVLAAFAVPKSWSKKKQQQALAGVIRPTGRPDGDNILKMLDSFNGVVWRDDAQAVDFRISKRYSDRPRLHVEVEALFGTEAA